jgi:hypothetical protein
MVRLSIGFACIVAVALVFACCWGILLQITSSLCCCCCSKGAAGHGQNQGQGQGRTSVSMGDRVLLAVESGRESVLRVLRRPTTGRFSRSPSRSPAGSPRQASPLHGGASRTAPGSVLTSTPQSQRLMGSSLKATHTLDYRHENSTPATNPYYHQPNASHHAQETAVAEAIPIEATPLLIVPASDTGAEVQGGTGAAQMQGGHGYILADAQYVRMNKSVNDRLV